ncbi:MAG: sensor histidine kinase, partial [Campylobacterota bacterium]
HIITNYVPLFKKDLNSMVDAGNYIMQVKVNISRHLKTMQRFQILFGVSITAVFLLLAMLFYFLRFHFTKPAQQISFAMKNHQRITHKNLLDKTDELGTLARSYNDLYENLQTQLGKNKELLEQNKRFIADTVHQVRTPLTNIMMNSEMIAHSLKDESVQNFIDQINASINMLTNSYEDLSYIISYDSIEYAPTMVDISAMLQGRLKFFTLIARVNFKSFETHIQPGISYMINPIELERIIDNNIANAIKYARPKQPIKITLHKNDKAIVMRFISVGAPIKNQSRIFEQNYREHHAKRGLGLGLNMVKKICQKYGIDYALSRKDTYNIFSYTFWI